MYGALFTFYTVGGEEDDVPSLQRVLMGAFRAARLGFGLPSQGGVVNLGWQGGSVKRQA